LRSVALCLRVTIHSQFPILCVNSPPTLTPVLPTTNDQQPTARFRITKHAPPTYAPLSPISFGDPGAFHLLIYQITHLLDPSALHLLTLPFREIPNVENLLPVTNFLDPCFSPAQQYKVVACRVHATVSGFNLRSLTTGGTTGRRTRSLPLQHRPNLAKAIYQQLSRIERRKSTYVFSTT
jgi:hypothetical protein